MSLAAGCSRLQRSGDEHSCKWAITRVSLRLQSRRARGDRGLSHRVGGRERTLAAVDRLRSDARRKWPRTASRASRMAQFSSPCSRARVRRSRTSSRARHRSRVRVEPRNAGVQTRFGARSFRATTASKRREMAKSSTSLPSVGMRWSPSLTRIRRACFARPSRPASCRTTSTGMAIDLIAAGMQYDEPACGGLRRSSMARRIRCFATGATPLHASIRNRRRLASRRVLGAESSV